MEKKGYWGKILEIDLTQSKIEKVNLPDSYYEQYLGGYGLGVRYLYEKIPKHADPLGPDNILGFCPGLLTGTPNPFTGRYMVCGKSPLTGGWGDANSGGYFGPAIKRCGIDAIFVKGMSEKPVILTIIGDTIDLIDGSEYWGIDAVETEKRLKEKFGKSTQVAAIGRGGENRSLISGIVNEMGRIAARSGLGAVMGAKKLKAIALNGNKKLELHDKEKLIKNAKEYNENVKKYIKSGTIKRAMKVADKFSSLMRRMKMGLTGNETIFGIYLHEYGTSFSTAVSAEIGDSPIKNWDGIGYIDFPQKYARKIFGSVLLNYKLKPYGCFSCPLSCGAILSFPDIDVKGKYGLNFDLQETHRAEYETLSALGSLILNHDLETLVVLNEYFNREGIDTISAGGVIAFAIESFKNGIITKEDLNGLELDWNKPEVLIPLAKMIVERKGLGNILADGVAIASKRIDKGSERYAVHSRGQELPMHDPKHIPGLALTYTYDPTPGRHTAACVDFLEMGPFSKFIPGTKVPPFKRYKYDSYAKGQAYVNKLQQTIVSLGFCLFGTWLGKMKLQENVEAVTGWKWTIEDMLLIGERIQNLRQMFNVKHGITQYYINPRAIGKEPQNKGPLKGVSIPLEEMGKQFFTEMGWDPNTGIPKRETLERLELDFTLGDLP